MDNVVIVWLLFVERIAYLIRETVCVRIVLVERFRGYSLSFTIVIRRCISLISLFRITEATNIGDHANEQISDTGQNQKLKI